MLADLPVPTSVSARWLAGTYSTSMSSRTACRLMSELLTISSPPGRISGSNLSMEGRFITIAAEGLGTTGEPISPSETMTVQLAVPPRISGP